MVFNPGGTSESPGDPELESNGLSELYNSFHEEDVKYQYELPCGITHFAEDI